MIDLFWLCPLGLFMNWFVRGGGWKSAIYNNQPPFYIPGDFVNAVVFGLTVWLMTNSIAFCFVAAAGMLIGSAPKLGAYVMAMKGDHPARCKAWGLCMMTLRGLVWGLCLSGITLSPSGWSSDTQKVYYASATILTGMTQGIIYLLFIIAFEKKNPTNIINHWTCSEMLHGALLWSCLALL
jgi:hypothetical protein